ncbi:MAG: dephospho-CoA kinase, partial [Clostridia bacterium]|nr:dephospho-CoA kinase [Clostridia bacterium]
MKVAVVGGIGTGKSTVMNIIRELGGNVILTDEL